MRFHKRKVEKQLQRPTYSIDATANYFEFPESAKRIYEYNSEAKIILLLRNPVERAYSHYKMAASYGFEKLPFVEALDLEEKRIAYGSSWKHNYIYQRLAYRAKGEYSRLIKPWLQIFPKEQLLIVQSERVFEAPQPFYEQVSKFLEIEKFEGELGEAKNKRAYEAMDADVVKQLREHYAPFNAELETMLGQNMNWG